MLQKSVFGKPPFEEGDDKKKTRRCVADIIEPPIFRKMLNFSIISPRFRGNKNKRKVVKPPPICSNSSNLSIILKLSQYCTSYLPFIRMISLK